MTNDQYKTQPSSVILNLFQNLRLKRNSGEILKQVQDDKRRGFTLVELILAIALFGIIFSTGSIALGNFMSDQALRIAGTQLVQTVREARTLAVAQHSDGDWGVFFDNGTDPDRYVLFQGSTYMGRDTSLDQVTTLHKSVSFNAVNFSGEAVIFDKRTGRSNSGSVELIAKQETFTIDVNGFGLTDFTD